MGRVVGPDVDVRVDVVHGGYKKEDMRPPRFTPDDFFKHAKPAGVSRAVLIQMSYPKDMSSEKGNGFDKQFR